MKKSICGILLRLYCVKCVGGIINQKINFRAIYDQKREFYNKGQKCEKGEETVNRAYRRPAFEHNYLLHVFMHILIFSSRL